MSRYDEVFARSIEDPQSFWADAAEDVYWYRKWDRVLDDSRRPFTRWFPGAEFNTCYNALDIHVENGFGDRPALIYDSPVTDTNSKITYAELLDQVATRVRDIASEYAEANGFDAIFPFESQPLVYVSESLIITEAVIQLYDERYPVDGGVFDIPVEGMEVLVPIRAAVQVERAMLFAVTVERPGGVVVSDRDRIVLVAQRT